MRTRHRFCLIAAGVLALGVSQTDTASAQTPAAAMHAIPAAECQNIAVQIQNAIGMAAKASEDDYTDLVDGSEGRSCHITASASDQALATPAELVAKVAKVFADWRDDPNRAAEGPSGSEKGYVKGNRIAAVDISWEPGPGVTCSDKQPLSACNITPQQKLWNVTVDIVEK